MAKLKDIHYNLNKLKGKVVEIYGTQSSFAKALGVSEKTMTSKMNGNAYFTVPEISKAVKILGLSAADIQEYFFTEKV